MNQAITPDDVTMAYRLILGREPESRQAVDSHLGLGTLAALRDAMIGSAEFQSKIHRMAFSGQSKWVAVEVLDRFIQWVDLRDAYVSAGCFNNNWEPDETAYFQSRLNPADTVLDIGANIGWFTLVAAKHAGKLARLHAFEPRPETARMLARTISANGLGEQVTLWEYALSDSRGEVDLLWRSDTDNPGHSFISANMPAAAGAYNSTKVTAAPLDELLPGIAPDLVKIDIEGAEPIAIRGAKKAISRRKPPILSELFPDQLKRVSGVTPAQYIDQMAQLGYRCFSLERGEPAQRLVDFPSNATTNVVSVVFECPGR